ncbi:MULTISPECIES: cell division protein SepF [unclassified Streptococcus]|uniref:cell division protein SepF n=1 Tax=unclassified Streptococcus TaxID=2608887 RepID=UPI0011B4D5AB|nr:MULTISPECIES: cell division protein SepF [unclassified Streptococcus]TWS95435.1 cell division protein SepF [Streptococcus sp. sy018]TWT16560.1 cell division protein SepF [Streptococcus sp. sy010]
MGLKDFTNNIISYFSTDEVSELEEFEQEREVAQSSHRQEVREHERPRPQAPRPQIAQPQREPVTTMKTSTQETVRTRSPKADLRAVQHQSMGEAVTIALKYPRKYEDAREIVALLNSNECVLIDFQYMLETQARRCLDFIDGASEVLSGNLQKVGSSMYLLTPASVVVDVEEMQIPNTAQDQSFDYDMKRR